MFAYCRNNPICRTDVIGTEDEAAFDDNTKEDLFEEHEGNISGAISTDYPTGQQVGGSGNSAEKSVTTYPQSPFDFNPNGLERRVHVEPGNGSNGGVIKWYYPGDKRPVFEWDEDWKIGSHYHAMEIEWGGSHSGDHLWPGSQIQEPWRSRFF